MALHGDSTPETRALLIQLTSELRHTQREVERLRRQHRVPPALVPVLLIALSGALVTPRLDAQSTGRVVAPFTVVTSTGQALLEVTESNGNARMRIGQVWLGTGASGAGFMEIQRSNNQAAINLGQRDGKLGVRILGITGQTELASMNEAAKGGGVFVANDGAGKTRMLVSGQGELHAVDPSGVSRATMTAEGAFSIRNRTNTTVARLGEAPSGAGMFQLANASGDAVVQAGRLGSGAGVVQTFPSGAPTGITGFGLPGTFITGFLGTPKR